nr:MFS transporter [Candidatus Bathyarchaeota archaeon]
LPIFLRDMAATNSEVFLAYFSSSAVSAATYSRVERISRGRSLYVQRGASAGRAVILAVFALSWLMARSKDGVAAVIVAMMFSGFTWAILNVAGPAAAVRITPREKRGEAIGTYNAVVSVSSIAGSALSGVVAQNLGYPVLFVSAASLALASIPLLRVVGEGVGRRQPPEGAC